MTENDILTYVFAVQKPLYECKNIIVEFAKEENSFHFKFSIFLFSKLYIKPQFDYRKDEHSLIATYCQKLSEGHLSQLIPESPMQVASEIDAEQRKELEYMIK